MDGAVKASTADEEDRATAAAAAIGSSAVIESFMALVELHSLLKRGWKSGW